MPYSYIVSQAIGFIRAYTFDEPLHHYVRKLFASRKQMGARDRRWMREVIYCWFRLGKALNNLPDEIRLQIAFFLSHNENDDLAKKVLTEVAFVEEDLTASLSEKIDFIKKLFPDFNEQDLFPFTEKLSEGLEQHSFIRSMLQQPKVFLRVLPDKIKTVTDELTAAAIAFETFQDAPLTIAVGPAAKLNLTRSFENGCFEIQDWASQHTGMYFLAKDHERWYDSCAASGGKSLMLESQVQNLNLTVSDSRSNILENLKERFRKAKLRNYQPFVADLENAQPEHIKENYFDGIIADVPCSGSGTWSRNPEQLQNFDAAVLKEYNRKQKAIVSNIVKLLKPGKPLIYITCSVFKSENEDVVDYISTQLGLTLEKMQLIQGTGVGGDTLFVARLIK